SAIFFDGELSHTVQKVPVPGDYRVQDDWGATDRPAPFTEDQVALARSIVGCAESILFPGAPRCLLYARVDFLVDDDGQEVLTELELVEPSLFFRHDSGAADRFAAAICRRVAAMS
ncbi:MAG: hypothetical protein QGG40_12560, partial [Myxococcota bacterium]|nr:hypothetical protein [Myxococcota bacterium]